MKKFEDMLPLSDADREKLEKKGVLNVLFCEDCPLDSGPGKPADCFKKVGFKEDKVSCIEVREEALRLDDEYRRKNMKSEILSQDDFVKIISNRTTEAVSSAPVRHDLIQSHAAALKKITDLQARLKKYEPADTRDEAWVKVCEEARKRKNKGFKVLIDEVGDCFVVSNNSGINKTRFPYHIGDDK